MNTGKSSPGAHLKPGCPEAWLPAPRLADWGPTPETLGGCAMGAEASCPPTGPKPRSQVPHATQYQSRPDSPEQLSPNTLDQPARLHSGPELRASQQPATQTQSRRWLIYSLAACEGPYLQLLPSPCSRSPAGPIGSLGRKQNTQQRGAAGLE